MEKKNSIPHIIHFCWFGRGEYSKMILDCLDSWKRILPDYEIKLWNEDTFDVKQSPWTKEAYDQKKWAFVSDYVRLHALSTYGGVYMDTDVEVLRNFSAFLDGYSFVTSVTEGGLISTSFIAAVKDHPYISSLLEYYRNKHFVNLDGELNMLMNPKIFSVIAVEKYNYDLRSTLFDSNGITIFPSEYFQPYRKSLFRSAELHTNYHITDNTFVIHKDMGSWAKQGLVLFYIKGIVRFLLPEKLYIYIKTKKNIKELKKLQRETI